MRISFRLLKYTFIIVISVVLLNACAEQECYTDTNPGLQVQFRQFVTSSTGALTDKELAVQFDSIVGIGAQDALLKNKKTAQVELLLPKNQDTTTFILTRVYYVKNPNNVRDSTQKKDYDTLTVAYTRKPSFISQECGFAMSFKDVSVIRHTFDSLTVVEPTISTTNNANTNTNANIKIYITK